MIACCAKGTLTRVREISADLAEIVAKPAYAGSMHGMNRHRTRVTRFSRPFGQPWGAHVPPTTSCLPSSAEQGLLEQALLELKRHRPGVQGEDPWQGPAPAHGTGSLPVAGAAHAALADGPRAPDDPPAAGSPQTCLPPPPACPASGTGQGPAWRPECPWPWAWRNRPAPWCAWATPCLWGSRASRNGPMRPCGDPSPEPRRICIRQIQGHCPEGLRILALEEISNHASPVLELCQEADWRWLCPAELRTAAEERFARFEAAASYAIAKIGKVEGQKQVKQVEVRHLVLRMGWEESALSFTTRLSAAEALNPLKLLAGVLGLEAGGAPGFDARWVWTWPKILAWPRRRSTRPSCTTSSRTPSSWTRMPPSSSSRTTTTSPSLLRKGPGQP